MKMQSRITSESTNIDTEIDRTLDMLANEVGRTNSLVYSLVCVLEVERPQVVDNNEHLCNPGTVAEVINGLANDLSMANDTLEKTIVRITEQVGKVKVLP